MIDLAALSKPFPKDKVHWRAQTVTKAGNTALALAYIDARDVMARLDEVCGPGNWQSEHFDCGGGKLGCKIGIRVCRRAETDDRLGDYSWVWKSDGAGATDIEGDKGAFSGALKRAAVSWGIGRYLYDMDAVWVPCEAWRPNENTKWKFNKFKDDPWKHVKGQGRAASPPGDPAPQAAPKSADTAPQDPWPPTVVAMVNAINQTETYKALLAWGETNSNDITAEKLGKTGYANVREAYRYALEKLHPEANEAAVEQQDEHMQSIVALENPLGAG